MIEAKRFFSAVEQVLEGRMTQIREWHYISLLLFLSSLLHKLQCGILGSAADFWKGEIGF